MNANITIFTNGYEGTWQSIELGTWLAKTFNRQITLVGVVENDDANHPVEDIFSRAVGLFQETKVDYQLELENGDVEEVIKNRQELMKTPKIASEPDYLVLVGTFGRNPVKKMIAGKSFRYIMESVGQPILYVPAFELPIKKILLCVGGLGYAVKAEPMILELAKITGASITLFTVVPPIEFDYPEARIVKENWNRLAETDTIIGRTLRIGVDLAKNANVPVAVNTRHGNVTDEINAEIAAGDYDLIVMGSQFSSHTLRKLYIPNVTADIAESCTKPILTVRCPADS
mgnify:CR=1 FL=1